MRERSPTKKLSKFFAACLYRARAAAMLLSPESPMKRQHETLKKMNAGLHHRGTAEYTLPCVQYRKFAHLPLAPPD